MEAVLLRVLNWISSRLDRSADERPDLRRTDEFWIGCRPDATPSQARSPIGVSPRELDRHLYILGASGSGKSRLLELLIRQHIHRAAGFCLVDPHGDLIECVVAFLYREHFRVACTSQPIDLNRVHLIEPFRSESIPGFNLLDPAGAPLYPHIAGVVGILRRLWLASWGPRMDELIRVALLTLALTRMTFTEVVPLLTNASFRGRIVPQIEDDALRAYWDDRYDCLSDAARAAVSDPVLNKVTALLQDPNLRCMFGQRVGSLDFRRLMDEGAWVLVNCSKGHLRDASYLLGSMVVAHLQSAAMSRADIPESARRPFTVLVDEFQNFRGDDFETILSEARKYRLRMVLAHQHLAQLDSSLQSAIFGNVGTHVVFAVAPQDANVIGREITDSGVKPQTLTQLPVSHALVRRRGRPAEFVQVLPVISPEEDRSAVAEFAAQLRAQHGRTRQDVEAEIKSRIDPPKALRKSRESRAAQGKSTSRRGKGTITAAGDLPVPPVVEADDD